MLENTFCENKQTYTFKAAPLQAEWLLNEQFNIKISDESSIVRPADGATGINLKSEPKLGWPRPKNTELLMRALVQLLMRTATGGCGC